MKNNQFNYTLSFTAILELGRYTLNDLSPHLFEWVMILEQYNCSLNFEDEIQKIARSRENPHLVNIFQALVLYQLQSIFIEKVRSKRNNVDFHIFVNGQDTTFRINGDLIKSREDFNQKLAQFV